MILSFADRETEKIWRGEMSRRLPASIQRLALRKLRMLDAAERLEDIAVPPGNRLERLTGDRRGRYSVRVNERWRICFAWTGNDCADVEIVDYH
jgi:proteic killer suppression protein